MPIKYQSYERITVDGQAVLNIRHTQRLLRYRESDKIYSRLERGMPYYELELLETIGETSESSPLTPEGGTSTEEQTPPLGVGGLPLGVENLVIRGECISACAYLKENNIKVDLVYIDPPFASGADYAKKVYLRKNPKLAEKIAEQEQEMDIDELKAFEEKMYGDIWQKEDYLNWMYENLMAIKTVMSDTASIYMHLDHHIGHYVKILMDEVFGEECFKNEIIWAYHGPGSPGQKNFTRKHDTIFWYVRNESSFIFNDLDIREAYHESTASKFDSEGTGFGGGAGFNENRGKIPEDWWVMPVVSRMRNEIVGYATQKPEKLLQRIIKASSNEGMVIADFFGGSGVTAKVANDLGRKFIHVDVGINSIQTVRDRLVGAKASFQILEIKDGVSLFRNPQQTMDKLAKLIVGLQKTKIEDISKFWFGTLSSATLGTIPVYVPNLLNTQEKVLDIPKINEIINQELQNLPDNIQKVVVYYIDIEDQKELEKFIRENNATAIEVELKDLKNVLHNVVIEDNIDFKMREIGEIYETEINKFVSDRLIQKIDEFNQKGNLQAIGKEKMFNPINISEEGLELIELIALDCENKEGVWHSSTEIKIDKLGYVIKDGVKSKTFWDGKIISNKVPLRLKIRNISGDETIKKID